jgi:hypothetical protein
MARGIPGDDDYYGQVSTDADAYPTSSLVRAFGREADRAVEAIVLRGYAGKTTVIDQAIEFVRIAGRNGLADDDVARRERQVGRLRNLAERNLLRIYLSPRLDRYVDFDRSCLMAWRHEANSLRQDMVTVWLKRYDEKSVPIVYRAIDEAVIGGAASAYLGGDLLDDWLVQAPTQSSARGDQAGGNLGNKPWTVRGCGG